MTILEAKKSLLFYVPAVRLRWLMLLFGDGGGGCAAAVALAPALAVAQPPAAATAAVNCILASWS